jgi:Ca-activated chloride channel family protein
VTTLAAFHFIRPSGLLLLPLCVGLWWLWQRYSHPLRGWQEQIAPELLRALVVGRTSAANWPVRGLLLTWLLAALTIAGPTWRPAPSPFADDATPLIIVLKADAGMERPGATASRLDLARLKIVDLANARKGQPLGLIAYAGSAHLVLPPTRDTAIIGVMAAEISPAIMPEPGDRLDLALREAAGVLAEGRQGGSVVVLADSVDTDPAALRKLRQETDLPVQFLALSEPDTPEDKGLRDGAHTLGATVETPDVAGGDIAALIRRAAGTPVAQQGGREGHWQEAGYWLLPLIALLALAPFRRKVAAEVAEKVSA